MINHCYTLSVNSITLNPRRAYLYAPRPPTLERGAYIYALQETGVITSEAVANDREERIYLQYSKERVRSYFYSTSFFQNYMLQVIILLVSLLHISCIVQIVVLIIFLFTCYYKGYKFACILCVCR